MMSTLRIVLRHEGSRLWAHIGAGLVTTWLAVSGCGSAEEPATSDDTTRTTVPSTGSTADEPAGIGSQPEPTAALADGADELEQLDWDSIYRDLVDQEQAALVANDLDGLVSVVTGRRLENLSFEVGLRRFRDYVLDDRGVNRTVDAVELAEVVGPDHVVLHVTESRNAPEVIRASDGAELHVLPHREESSQRIQVDLDEIDGEWRVEHHYYLGTSGGIEPLPDEPPAVTVDADGHSVDVFSWLTDDGLECIGFDGVRPDGTGIGDWTQCRPTSDFEPPVDEFTWQILPIAGDGAPLIHLVVGSASLRDDVLLDGENGAVTDRPEGGTLTVWLQAQPGLVFGLATRPAEANVGRLGETGCGESRRIGRHPPDFVGDFSTLADIADAAAEQLRTIEWQAGSVEVADVQSNRFTILADDVDHETLTYTWEWRFSRSFSGRGLELASIVETRTCR